MYKLTYYKAVNFKGYKSGLGRKIFELNLEELIEFDSIVILGDNGLGKSVLMSTISPKHTPTDNRNKFIIEGKEGMLIREYTSIQDGSKICCSSIYTPKSDGSHSAKCYFKMINGDTEVECNASGNVSSYQDLLKIHFGIDYDFLKIASYNDSMKGIVSMTTGERKDNITSFTPNSSRIMLAYETVNEKFKVLRAIIRNTSDKLTKLRDETTLKTELKRIEKYINSITDQREEEIKTIATLEGRYAELTKEHSSNELYKLCREMEKELRQLSSGIDDDKEYLSRYNVVSIDDKLRILNNKKLTMESRLPYVKETKEQTEEKVYELDKKINDNRNILYSYTNFDIESLKKTKKEYEDKISNMRYSKMKDKMKDMSYGEAMLFISNLSILESSVDGLHSRFGNLVTEFVNNRLVVKFRPDFNFNHDILVNKVEEIKEKIKNTIAKRNEHFNSSTELKAYKKFEEQLKLRPSKCDIDTCPFISNSLKWTSYKPIADKLDSLVEELDKTIDKYNDELEELDEINSMIQQFSQFMTSLNSNRDLFIKYFEKDIDYIMNSLKSDRLPEDIFNLTYLRDVASVLSEKELYNDILYIKLPEVQKNIDIAATNENEIARITAETVDLDTKLNNLKDENYNNDLSLFILNKELERVSEDIEYFTNAKVVSDRLKTNTELFNTKKREYDNITENASNVIIIDEKLSKLRKRIKDFDDLISPEMRKRDMIKYEYEQVLTLKLDKETVERDYNVVEMIRSVIQPGKGIWSILINMYMNDIKVTANQILEKTFGGNLYLDDFIIDDKDFRIPYVFNGEISPDVSYASSSQQTTISNALSFAILGTLISKYGIVTIDEMDKDLSPNNKEIFIDILSNSARIIGIIQNFIITHSPEYYDKYDVGYILFPGAIIKNKKSKKYVEV